MHQHHRWAQATTFQISIAMAAMALLTKRRWLEQAVFQVSGLSIVVGLLAFCIFDLAPP